MKRAVVLMALLAGCAGNYQFNAPPPCAMNECPIESLPFAVEVSPAVEMYQGMVLPARFAAQEKTSVGFDALGQMVVTLTPAVKVYGFVKIGTTGVKINGSIVASRPSRIPGRPDRTYSAQIAPDGSYQLRVPPNVTGEQYTLRIDSSDDSTYPPQVYTVFADEEVYFDFKLDDPLDLTQLTGTITNPLGSALSGMRVQAVDQITRKSVSTSVLTDDQGKYLLRLAKKTAGTVVRLEATPSPTAPLGTPVLSTLVDVSKVGPANTLTLNVQAPAAPAPTPRTYRVSGTDSTGADRPVVGAHCLFTADISDTTTMVTATHSVLVQTDADGHASVALIAGDGGATRKYNVTISPPAESEFQGASMTIQAGANPGVGPDITLALRPQLIGRIIDMLGRPLSDVTVQPGPSTVDKIASATTLADLFKLTQATTDRDGRFTLRVDAGNYDLGIIPLTASRLPRRWLDNQPVLADTHLGDVLAPPGTTAKVVVVDPQGNPLKAASVEIYELSKENTTRMCESYDLACLAPPRLTAEGKTGSDGTVPILLPAAVQKPAGSR